KPIWSRNVLLEHNAPNPRWAKSDSPLIYDDLVVVTGGDSDGPTVLAYHKGDGKPAWTAGKDKASYASPVLATLAGVRQVLSVNAASVTAHDPADGHILWDHPWPSADWPKCSQPVPLDGDRVFVSAGYGAGCQMLQVE